MKKTIYTILLMLAGVLTATAQNPIVGSTPVTELSADKMYVFQHIKSGRWLSLENDESLALSTIPDKGSIPSNMIFCCDANGTLEYTAPNINTSGVGFQVGEGSGGGTILLAPRRRTTSQATPVYLKDKEGQYLMVYNDNVFGITANTAQETQWLAYEVRSPKAVYDESTLTLTWYYDGASHAGEGTVYGIYPNGAPKYSEHYSALINPRHVVFDRSVANWAPTSLVEFFAYFYDMVSIEGLEYLNTQEVTSMASMFDYCKSITELDLRTFDTSKVNDGFNMTFYNCKNLSTIYVSDKFKVNSASEYVFCNSTKLVGGKGTTYMENHYDTDYARIDGGSSAPGYFSDKVLLLNLDYSCTSDYSAQKSTLTFTFQKEAEGDIDVYQGDTNVGTIAGGTSFTINDLPLGTYTYTFRQGDYVRVVEVNTDTRKAKVVYKSTEQTMIWYYDDQSHQGEGQVYFLPDYANDPCQTPAWLDENDNSRIAPTTAKFDASFADCCLFSCRMWFYGLSGLQQIDGLNYLNTSRAIDMGGMFHGCAQLTSLDLSKFDTSNVEDMYGMFQGCASLQTIYASSAFTISAVDDEWYLTDTFAGCTNLKGGNGTVYNSDHTDATYARIDGVDSAHGYFTEKPCTPGDLNADGNVTIADLTLLVELLNSNGTITNPAADVDGDGDVDIDDVNALRQELLGE